jgi:CheY-like chemotaxis protein
MRVISEQSKGSEFHFTLPVSYHNENQEPTNQVYSKSHVKPAGKRTILVAEDVDSNFNLIQFFLKSISATSIRAYNGQEAVDYFNKHPEIDLILMDIKMPVMDGYTAIRLIRETNKDIPIIAQTAFADDTLKTIECGCNGFISKPFDKQHLISVINEYL